MRIAFCLFHYFPFGGLQRDFFQTALYCQQQGHDVHVYTMSWEGERPSGLTIHTIPVFAFTNHGKASRFSKKVNRLLKKESFDCVLGFNKMPGLDYYYAADVCYVEERLAKRGRWIYFFPRDRGWIKLEKSVFSETSKTHVFMLNEVQLKSYQAHYKIPDHRITLLSPSLPASRYPSSSLSLLRNEARSRFQVSTDQFIILTIASSLKTKGFDRTIFAYKSLPGKVKDKTVLWIVGGQDIKEFTDYLNGVRVKYWGLQEDVLPYLHAADVFVHPARVESAGLVLLEAMVNGVPVVTTSNCGYAHYISESRTGFVCQTPFHQQELNDLLLNMLNDENIRAECSRNGSALGQQKPWTELPPKLLNVILK